MTVFSNNVSYFSINTHMIDAKIPLYEGLP